jgi:hypothetical protein
MSIRPGCTILRHTKDPSRFILERMCELKGIGCLTSWGRLVHLTEHDIRTRVIQLILEDFAEFQSRDSDDGAEASGLSSDAKRVRKMLREFDAISVSLESSTALHLAPVCKTGWDRGSGFPEDMVTVPLPCAPETFFGILTDAFGRCRVVKKK